MTTTTLSEHLETAIAEGIALFARSTSERSNASNGPADASQYNILAWFCQYCGHQGLRVSMAEQHYVVDSIRNKVNKVLPLPGHVLTAEVLQKILAKVPGNTPVLYQRIEDIYFEQRGWKAVPLTWDTVEATEGDKQYVKEHNPTNFQLVNLNGVEYARMLSDYIPAFGAYLVTTDTGEQAVCIHAHY